MAEDDVMQKEGIVVRVEISQPPDNLFTVSMCERLTALLEFPPTRAQVIKPAGAGGGFCRGHEPDSAQPRVHGEIKVMGMFVSKVVDQTKVFASDRLVFGFHARRSG